MMPSYTTSSGFNDLDGTCEISDDTVTSYISNILGPAKVTNLGSGLSLNFKLKFGSGDVFVIVATGSGSGFSGTASHNGSPDEPWAAGATSQSAVSGRSNEL